MVGAKNPRLGLHVGSLPLGWEIINPEGTEIKMPAPPYPPAEEPIDHGPLIFNVLQRRNGTEQALPTNFGQERLLIVQAEPDHHGFADHMVLRYESPIA
jgi:hypothetical protein